MRVLLADGLRRPRNQVRAAIIPVDRPPRPDGSGPLCEPLADA
jgi:hypothetical protein